MDLRQRPEPLGRVVAMSYKCSVRIAPGSRANRTEFIGRITPAAELRARPFRDKARGSYRPLPTGPDLNLSPPSAPTVGAGGNLS
jgi:hypothetical protein